MGRSFDILLFKIGHATAAARRATGLNRPKTGRLRRAAVIILNPPPALLGDSQSLTIPGITRLNFSFDLIDGVSWTKGDSVRFTLQASPLTSLYRDRHFAMLHSGFYSSPPIKAGMKRSE
ncbi:MAG: hypothetical protein FWC43_00005, partial [Planctomycetaceae bacterium]|nr:hypothetical protein [Planctomycetaceae bacterium]